MSAQHTSLNIVKHVILVMIFRRLMRKTNKKKILLACARNLSVSSFAIINMIENDPPPSYEVAIGIEPEDGIVKGPPPPNYDNIITANQTLIPVDPDDVFLGPLSAPPPLDTEQPESSSFSCIAITMLIAACITVLVLGFQKDKSK